ncbi:MAG: hypothetical protein ABIJ09_25065 [Pseudomonadota bacterium]
MSALHTRGLVMALILGCTACPPATPTPDAGGGGVEVCGDGTRQAGEVCDGPELGGATCVSLGFAAGELRCQPRCQDFDRSGCGAPEGCGDGTRNGVERCDGADLGGATCEQQGHRAGELRCSSNCGELDVTRCGPPLSCGDGVRDGIELCDRDDFGGLSCAHLGYTGGYLICGSTCQTILRAGCRVENCTPTTCAAEHASCGEVWDNCGQWLACGQCTAPQVCGGSGTANTCGSGTCTPRSCGEQGRNCGTVPDGCGNRIDCGECVAPMSCGGGGTPNLCGCTPSRCEDLGANCGELDDGCGASLDCGLCSGGAICGGGGHANRCGPNPCTPATCTDLSATCGLVSDGCDALLNCGSCQAPNACGVAGALTCAPRPCTGSSQCPYGELCSGGHCEPLADPRLCLDCDADYAGCVDGGQHACLVNLFFDAADPRTAPPSYCSPSCVDDTECPAGMRCSDRFSVLDLCDPQETCADGQSCRVISGTSTGYCPCQTDTQCTDLGVSGPCTDDGLCLSGRACKLLADLQCADLGR